jgi:mono/diheme cytochrome c family protein
MHSRSLVWGIRASLFVALASLGACGGKKFQPEGGPFVPPPTTATPSTAGCPIARGSEALVPRVDLTGMNASSVGGQDVAYTSDLFGQFYAFCGGCHVDGAQGTPPRHIAKTVDSFVATFDATWLAPIMSDDPDKWMPRPGKAWSTRTPGDPVYDFVMHAQAWLSAGKPKGVYAVDGSLGGVGSGGLSSVKANYTFTASVAAAMTNIGNCVPTSALFASSTSDVMTSMDELFKNATELPKTLGETDLTTLDSEELARTAVIAYAPTYALWSAGSGKLRHIRVPRGQSVKFDKATQTFDIPDNTRFYKTFFRRVVDRTGAVTWRKMETRVILARADDVDPNTHAIRQNALYGTYIWNEDETSATFASQPYRDQDPKAWADIVRTYITDELLYQNILDTTTGSVDGAVALAIKSHPDEPAYRDLLQHYAIPGKLRCVQCHMGSPTKDFVLGFIPLQVKRRATGTGGTYDVTGADELTQLQRLIDVGVITGITSPEDIKPLEESQGERTPRNTACAEGDDVTADGELKAQAYMLGNCAHCHNPRGFPSITKPELTNVLNFLPDGKDGGIFEFPFERFSPIRARGSGGEIPIPYVTPSLRDYPTATADGQTRIDTGENIVQGAVTYTPKFFPQTDRTCAETGFEPDFRAFCGDRKTGLPVVAAPWRSLIYRNVDTPTAYFDDFVPFPHMPMNTAGFDCRAPRIMGDWMVGLPSVRKLTQLADLLGTTAPSEDALPGTSGRAPVMGALKTGYDDNPQPYFEVPPDSTQYAQALKDARARMVEYHEGVRYQYCQDVISPDIFDPFVPVNVPEYTYHPNPYEYQLTSVIEVPPLDPMHSDRYVQPRIGVPYHAHWINYDPTDPPPPWVPRRTDWKEILVGGMSDTGVPIGMKSPEQLEAEGNTADADAFRRRRAYLARALSEADLTDALRSYATSEKPFATWLAKPACMQKLAASQKTISQLAAAERPAWIDVAKPDPGAYVYNLSPGAFVFRHVCINCHGPNADGKGIQVDLLAAASEGEARPANFKSGLFGPPETPLSNIMATFDVATTGSRKAADVWGSRYMSWMALGGTLKRIPQDIIHLVATTPILGHTRENIGSVPGSSDPTGNMLNLAKGICAIVLPAPANNLPDFERSLFAFISNRNLPEAFGYPPYNHSGSPLVASTYDKEMWLHLCSDFSPQVVRVYGSLFGAQGGRPAEVQILRMYYAVDPAHVADPSHPANYPADARVWDHTKTTQTGVTRQNLFPACLDPDKISAAQIASLKIPTCPPAFLQKAKPMWIDETLSPDPDDQLAYAGNVQVWTLRGAIATGMSVFSYLEQRLGDPNMSKLPPYYDQCEQLP